MGYFTLDFKKAKGASDARMSDHIERRVIASNVDPTRTHLNRELVQLPKGVTERDEAIAHRIKSAGIKRKITPTKGKGYSCYAVGNARGHDEDTTGRTYR